MIRRRDGEGMPRPTTDEHVLLGLAAETGGMYAGLLAAGVAAGPAALVAIPAAMLLTWWSKEKSLEERMAYYAAMGYAPAKPDIRYRGVLYEHAIREAAEENRRALAAVLAARIREQDPSLTDAQVQDIAEAAAGTMRGMQIQYPDLPEEFVADVVLLMHMGEGEPPEVEPPGTEAREPVEIPGGILAAVAGLILILIFSVRR